MSIKWYDFQTYLSCFRRIDSKAKLPQYKHWREIYTYLISGPRFERQQKIEIYNEARWYSENKPYYRLYPSIIFPFLRLNLDKVDTGFLKLPKGISTLLIQIPQGSVVSEGLELRNILLATIFIDDTGNRVQKDLEPTDTNGIFGVVEYARAGETRDEGIVTAALSCPLTAGTTIQQAKGLSKRVNVEGGPSLPMDLYNGALKIIGVCLLLENDPQIIAPDVLSDDLRKWQEMLDPKYVERARRRGKYGWVLGREIEVIPHYRRPHAALFWTGKGRFVPIVKMRAGTIVHREIIEEIPTGFEEDENVGTN